MPLTSMEMNGPSGHDTQYRFLHFLLAQVDGRLVYRHKIPTRNLAMSPIIRGPLIKIRRTIYAMASIKW